MVVGTHAHQDLVAIAILSIGRNPELGRPRDDLPSTQRAHLVGSHVIVHRPRDAQLEVVRFLHQLMRLGRQV
jgi:plasmid stabilization system protein ParE